MSAGDFERTKYESNSGAIYSIKIQPETAAATIAGIVNGPPAGAIDQESSASARGSNRRIGVTARTVTLRYTGAKPTDYSGDTATIPVLSPDTFDFWINPRDKTGTYLSVPVQVVGSDSESVN